MKPISDRLQTRAAAFTIVELLVSTVVFVGILTILVITTSQTANIWHSSAAKVEQFQQARRGFEAMTRKISQATLNTYWDYDFPIISQGGGRFKDTLKPPDGYSRQSELRFRSAPMKTLELSTDTNKNGSVVVRPTDGIFFQAPLGYVEEDQFNSPPITTSNSSKSNPSLKPLNELLNTWGYFIEVSDDSAFRPHFLEGIVPKRVRSRLMELMEPAALTRIDNPAIDEKKPTSYKQNKVWPILDPHWNLPWDGWFSEAMKRPGQKSYHVLAENIVALVILPRLSQQDEAERAKTQKELLCPLYDYDSKRNANDEAAIKNPTAPSTKNTDPEVNPKNQLPPVVQVVMIALDETAGDRLASLAGGDPNIIAGEDPKRGLDFSELFKDARVLENNKTGKGDIAKMEDQLIDKRLTYRIFTSNVGIRGAKWSRSQTK